MALTVRTNLTTMNSISYLNTSNQKLSSSLERISSGMRINSAADDAAGLGVAESLDAAGRSLRMAMRNTNDGIAVVQTAEGAANEVANIIKRMRELAIQSASETMENTERTYINDEFTALSTEVDRIATVTEFNGLALADGTNATINVQVGINNVAAIDRIAITLGDLTSVTLGVDTGSIDLSTAAGAQGALAGLDAALDAVNQNRSTYGATQNRLESAYRALDNYTQNLASAESQIRDTDFAVESAEMAKLQIMQQAGVAALAQAKSINSQAAQLLQ
ncbi:MAG TPA: flagellin FliC [Deltaproteobacteria bacterium]|nr:flagellin FliC [Deltaproteobacteria bacterium]